MKSQENERKVETVRTENAKDVLLCKSAPANLRPILLTYAGITAIVVAFQVFFFLSGVFHVIQIAVVVAFLLCVIWYAARTVRDAKNNFLNLYERHYQTKDGSFSYRTIRDMDVGRGQLTLKAGRPTTIYAANAEELARVIRSRRNAESNQRCTDENGA